MLSLSLAYIRIFFVQEMKFMRGMSKSILAQIKYLTQSSNYLKSAS